MIPEWNDKGLLPGFLGEGTSSNLRAPWRATPLDLVERFCVSEQRRDLLRGLFRYRATLRAAGVVGVQWIDGSFAEDCDLRGRVGSPHDIDVVTVHGLPEGATIESFEDKIWMLFRGPAMKPEYGCDAYNIPLYGDPFITVRDAVFWSGLFSHTKNDASLKGLCLIPLTADAAEDDAAHAHIESWGIADA